MTPDHPDLLQDYHALKQIEKGARQAITTAAMNAMWEAIEAGKSKEEAEQVFLNHFNKSNNDRIAMERTQRRHA